MASCETMPDSKFHRDVDIYGDDIDLYLAEFCSSHGVADPYDMRPQQWTAALLYIYRHTFAVDNSSIRPRGVASYGYDLDAVHVLLDRYIYLCMEHNQRISITGFSCLSGIDSNTIHNWGNGNYRSYDYYTLDGHKLQSCDIGLLGVRDYVKKPTSKAQDIYKKIVKFEGQSLEDSLTDRKKNPMHTLPLFNAFQARHATKQERPQLDTGSIAESLGITAELQGIPDKKNHSNG